MYLERKALAFLFCLVCLLAKYRLKNKKHENCIKKYIFVVDFFVEMN